MKTFNEYLNSKGQVETGKVDIHGDRTDPMTPPNKPPKEHGKKPYIAKGEKNSQKGLGDHGEKELKYEPDTGKDSKKPADIPTVESFAQYELVPLVSESMEQNPNFAEHVVRDLKRRGLLGVLVDELMEHRETYKHIARLVINEDEKQNKLTRAMEEVSPAYSSQTDEDDLEQTGLEDVEVDDDTMDLEIDEPDAMDDEDLEFDDDEDLEFDDEEELGDLNGMGNDELPTFQKSMMSRR